MHSSGSAGIRSFNVEGKERSGLRSFEEKRIKNIIEKNQLRHSCLSGMAAHVNEIVAHILGSLHMNVPIRDICTATL